MAAAVSSVKSLSSLLSQTSLDDHDEILKAANAAIKKSKSDVEAQQVKAVALLHLERYEDAVKVFEDEGDKLKERAWLEYAYGLYRCGRPSEAVKISESREGGRGLKHVLAQAAYRTENFEQAATVYREIAGEQAAVENEENDLNINSGAVDAQLEWAGFGHVAQKKEIGREVLEAFETAYNAACVCISRGELVRGEFLLKRAKDLCNALEDLTEEEKKAEVLPITVQQVFVLAQLGKVDEAEQLCTSIPFAEVRELSTRYIAQVNSIALYKEHSNPYLSHRLFHSQPKPPKTDQLFDFQSNALRQNVYVMDLLSHKYPGVAQSTAQYITHNPSPTTSASVNSASVMNAAAHAKTATGKAALKEILPLLEKRPSDVGLLLTITNLYVLTNNHAAAIHLLESFFKRLEQSGTSTDLDVRYAPGLIGTIVSLYAIHGRNAHSKTELAKAASYWRHKSKTPPQGLMKAAGIALLESKDLEELKTAGAIFASLHDQDPSDKGALAGLVAAHAITDPSELTPDLVDALPTVDKLVSSIDAAELEDAGVAVLPTANTALESRKRPAEKQKPVRAKKLRKTRMPKDYDPNKKVDPERWLPMRDRSYYRPRGKKGKKKMEGLTQGGAVVEEKAQEGKQAAGGGGGQQKKKKAKGKGGKW